MSIRGAVRLRSLQIPDLSGLISTPVCGADLWASAAHTRGRESCVCVREERYPSNRRYVGHTRVKRIMKQQGAKEC